MMLKGVSQKVIEVVHTDNRYFEKAILFLRPTAQEEDRTQMKTYAKDYLQDIEYMPEKQRGRHKKIADAAKIFFGVLVGALSASLYFIL